MKKLYVYEKKEVSFFRESWWSQSNRVVICWINSSPRVVLINWNHVGVGGVGGSVMDGALIVFEILNLRRRIL